MLTLTKAALTATVVGLTCLGASRSTDSAATGAESADGNASVASVSQGGKAAIQASNDPLILAMRDIDAQARVSDRDREAADFQLVLEQHAEPA